MDLQITLDYEIFLNDHVGTVENSLLKPMDRILEICRKHGIKITVFVDSSYLYRLNELSTNYPALRDDFEKVSNNIKRVVSEGHDVQLHIHPQWYYCTYDGNDWTMDWEHYKLSDMPEEQAMELFKKSKDLLDSVVGYKTTAFRAGGYSIQQFDYARCFRENGIKYDSSVLSDCRFLTDTHYYDYKGLPKRIYKFSKIEKEDGEGEFIEVPIATRQYNFFRYVFLKKKRQSGGLPKYGDGGDNPERLRSDRFDKIRQYLGRPMNVSATFDWYTYGFIEEVLEKYKPYGYATIISHPKNVSPTSLEFMDSFIGRHLSAGDNFITISQINK